MKPLDFFLQESARRHDHLCPRQVLGVRMGILAARLLDLPMPQPDKRVVTIVETDGCLCDGIEVATGCSVGHRTMRIEDLGKVAATFVDTRSHRAVRIAPHPGARQHAVAYIPFGGGRWDGQLIGYQHLPDALLLTWESVALTTPIETIVGIPGVRAICDICGEEILNQREIVRHDITVCRSCAGQRYYQTANEEPLPKLQLITADFGK